MTPSTFCRPARGIALAVLLLAPINTSAQTTVLQIPAAPWSSAAESVPVIGTIGRLSAEGWRSDLGAGEVVAASAETEEEAVSPSPLRIEARELPQGPKRHVLGGAILGFLVGAGVGLAARELSGAPETVTLDDFGDSVVRAHYPVIGAGVGLIFGGVLGYHAKSYR